MLTDKKKLANLREETGVCYLDKDEVEKAMNISRFSLNFAKSLIKESKVIIKKNKMNTKIFTSYGVDESLCRRTIALNKIEEAKMVMKECKKTIKRERGTSKVLKRQYKKLSD